MKGEKLIDAYVQAVIERDSYKPQPGEEQTPERESALKLANANMKTAYAQLNGSMLGEARRRLAGKRPFDPYRGGR